jgi:hypothetical protein
MEYVARPVQVYALFDPRDGSPRYVGQSLHAENRYRQHISQRHWRNHNGRVNQWIRQLHRLRLIPEMRILQTCQNLELALDAEMRWALMYAINGFHLLNANLLHCPCCDAALWTESSLPPVEGVYRA